MVKVGGKSNRIYLTILAIFLIYLYKFSISPFLPANLSPLYLAKEQIPSFEFQDLLYGYYFFGRLLNEITGVGIEIMRVPIFLIPQFVLLLSIVRLVANGNNGFIIFLGLLTISMYTEGIYLNLHEFGFILFLTFFLMLLLYCNTNNNKFSLLLIVVFSILNFGSYKLTYLTVLMFLSLLVLQRVQGRKEVSFYYLFFVMIVLVFVNEFLYKRAIPQFLIYKEYGIGHGFFRFLWGDLFKVELAYCFEDVCFQKYSYPNPFFRQLFLYGMSLSSILFSIYFVKINIKKVIYRENLDFLSMILLAFLISGVFLALTYSILGLFYVHYIILPSSIIMLYLISKKISERKIRILTFVLLICVSLVYVGTIEGMDQRFDPFSNYVKTTVAASQWTSAVSETSQKVMVDIFTRGVYTINWNIEGTKSGSPVWIRMKDLARFYSGNSKSKNIYILNYGLPWWEMENWYKILPPAEYRTIVHIYQNYNLVYSSEELEIVIAH